MTTPGDYSFRMHADYGLGSFIGVDGSSYTPGNIYGHISVDGTALTAGEHEFDALGFEDCCDGHAELEVHMPCDKADSPWRIVQAGLDEGPLSFCLPQFSLLWRIPIRGTHSGAG